MNADGLLVAVDLEIDDRTDRFIVDVILIAADNDVNGTRL